jgi:hypothetical protein
MTADRSTGIGQHRRVFTRLDDGYALTLPDDGLRLEARYLRRERSELFGELNVLCDWSGARTFEGALITGDVNFSSVRARIDRAKQCAERSHTKPTEFDWTGLLEEFSVRLLRAEREGEPAIVLPDVPRPAVDAEYDVHGLRFPKDHLSIWFGDGGSGKSLTELFCAGELELRGVRVALFDWEMDEFTHRLRLERLYGAEMPRVRYVRCARPLVHDVDRLRRIVRDEQIQFGFFDSIGFATDGPPEAAESALGFCRAFRQLGIGGVALAHVTKADNADQRPFGSTFWHNSARSTWNVKQAASTDDTLTIGIFNRKSNIGRTHAPIGFEIAFTPSTTTFTRVNVADVSELAEALPMWQRMQHRLRSGPMTLARLADELGANVETLDRTVRRKSALFVRLPGSDGITRVALAERRQIA